MLHLTRQVEWTSSQQIIRNHPLQNVEWEYFCDELEILLSLKPESDLLKIELVAQHLQTWNYIVRNEGKWLNDKCKWKSHLLMVYSIMKTGGWAHIRNNSWVIQKWGRDYIVEITRRASSVWKFKYNKNYISGLLSNSFCFDSWLNGNLQITNLAFHNLWCC